MSSHIATICDVASRHIQRQVSQKGDQGLIYARYGPFDDKPRCVKKTSRPVLWKIYPRLTRHCDTSNPPQKKKKNKKECGCSSSSSWNPSAKSLGCIKQLVEGWLIVIWQEHWHTASPKRLKKSHGPRRAPAGHQAENAVAHKPPRPNVGDTGIIPELAT